MKTSFLLFFTLVTSIGFSQVNEIQLDPNGIVFPRMNTAQRNALSPVQGQCIYNTQSKALECYNGTVWSVTSGGGGLTSILIDSDGDTSIDVETTPDDDVISFSSQGVEVMNHDGQTLNFTNNGQSLFIGENAGAVDDLSDNRNTFVGSRAGEANTSGTQNVALGHQAMKDNIGGSSNVAIGLQALQKNKNSNNIAIGFNAARDNNNGNKNTAIGGFSGFTNQNGNENTFIGYEAGRNISTTSSGNVMIGHQAGMSEIGNNRLYIANDDTADPLVYGEFDAKKLKTNGSFEATETIKVGSNNIFSPDPGTIRFNSSNNDFEGWNGSRWLSLTRLMQAGNGVTDIDNNSYQTVIIGTQEWMTENLKVSRYNDGSGIANITSNLDWSNLNSGGWCHFDNDVSNESVYGKLYNWYAVDNGNLCPSGWHVATKSEYQILRSSLGNSSVAGGKMKESGSVNWNSPNIGASNESGLTVLGSGRRSQFGSFSALKVSAYVWTSDAQFASSGNGDSVFLNVNSSELFFSNFKFNEGQAVRCVKD